MKVNCIVGLSNKYNHRVSFKRHLYESEKPDFQATNEKAFEYLGIKNRALIIHGSSFPVRGEYDQKIGSPNGSDEFLDFVKLQGFNAIQEGPSGALNLLDNSPYVSSVIAKNTLFIDFSLLTKPEYASILTLQDIANVTERPESSYDNIARTDFNSARSITNEMIKLAYYNFKKKLDEQDSGAYKLNQEFLKFKKENSSWLDYYAILDIFSKSYGTEDYTKLSPRDRDLIKGVKKGNTSAIKYFKELLRANKLSVELYKFGQFLIDKQTEENNEKRTVIRISDFLVGVSKADEVVFSDVFLKKYRMGTAGGGPLGSQQLWDIPVLDPKKLFNDDGSLGPAGEFLKLKIERTLQGAKNVRVDHAIGLVDPYIYDKETVKYRIEKGEDGKEYKIPDREKIVAGSLSTMGIDRAVYFESIIPEILLPILEEKGIDPKNVAWEDIGSDETGKFNKIFRQENNLPGISSIMWSRGQTAPKDNWAYIGCHDDAPLRQSVNKDWVRNSDAWNLDYLSGYLFSDPSRESERWEFREKIKNSPKELVKAKFVDLLRSAKNIQISFMDFFGINSQYNVPGDNFNKENWTLRLSDNYEKQYYDDLINNKGYALNMPELLATAVEAKRDLDFVEGRKTKEQSEEETKELLEKLHYYSEILKEEE